MTSGGVMGWFVLFLVIAGCVGGVMLNHRNSAAALGGVKFHVDATPKAVGDAVVAAYCTGKKSALKMMVMRLTVKARGDGVFDVKSSIGDVGRIIVQSDGNGSQVWAHTTELYVGSHPKSHLRGGSMALPSMMVHGIYKALGLAPNAVKMKRFQSAVERNVLAQLRQRTVA